MHHLVGVQVANACQDLSRIKLDGFLWQFFTLMMLVDKLDAPPGHVLQIDAELVAYNFTANVFHDIIVIQLPVYLNLVLKE